MILRKFHNSVFLALLVFLPAANFEKTYDTNDWIPINPEQNLKPINRESKSSDRILNVDDSAEIFRKPSHLDHHKIRKSHKRSPNQNRIRPKFEQPYRFENVYNAKQHQTKIIPNFPKYYKTQYPTIPQYQQQHQNFVPQFQNFSPPIFQNLGPGVINSELFEAGPHKQQKFVAQQPPDDKDTVQLLYVPLEQLQKQQGGILDDAFKSLQQQKLITQPQEQPQALPLVAQNQQVFIDNPKFLNQVLLQDEQRNQQIFADKPKYSTIPVDAFKLEQPQEILLQRPKQQQQFFLDKPKYSTIPVEALQQPQQRPKQPQNHQFFLDNEQPKYYELISKNRGELILQNNPKTVHVAAKQQVQVQPVEQQQIVELTSEKPQQQQRQQTYVAQTQNRNPQSEQQQTYVVQQTRNPTQQSYVVQQPGDQQEYVVQQQNANQQRGQQEYIVQHQSNNPAEQQGQQTYVVQQQTRTPLTAQQQQNQQAYFVQQQTRNPSYTLRNERQKSRLEDIQKDILQQTLEVEKLQQQIQQQGKSIEFSTTQAPAKKRKPHQPPLAVFMGGNNQGDIETVLEILKNAKSISVQDQITPNSPRVFVGPSNLNTPEGFVKFPLPYLSNLDNNRIQRKAQQLPFFVAPLNYKEPDGYAKIPLPSPHVGSVVIRENQLQEAERPLAITNYKFVNPALESTKSSNFDNNLNVYSLDSQVPRDSPNRQLKEQALFQQITGFSGFELPQNHQYFQQQVNPQPELSTPEDSVKTIGRPRGETSRGHKKGQSILKDEHEQKQEVEVSTQTPLTHEYLNRFGSTNRFEYSTTPTYVVSSQGTIEELPANIEKLEPNDGSLEQAIEELQKTRITTQQTTQPDEYNVPVQFTNINPRLPGLVNDLQDQDQPVSTTTTTTTTEATTTHKPRGRGRSRFHMKTTTPQPYRRPSYDRRRPQKPTTETSNSAEYRNNYENLESERVRPKTTRLQNSLNERVAEGSVEAAQPQQQIILQNQPNYFMEFLSTVDDERPVLGQSEEVKTEPGVRVVEQYQSEKITPAEQLQPVQVSRRPLETTPRPSEPERPPRRRVRVRGRPKNVYSSTTAAPTTTQKQEEEEFYGFVRQPQYSHSSQINNNDEQLHIYAPVQQQRTSPVYIPETTSKTDVDTTVKFLGELRPKYASPSRATTTEATTTRVRTRGRVRVPGRVQQESTTTEKSLRGRTRGRTHFTPSRNVRQEESETENYPASFLKSRQSTTPSNQFKITVEPNEKNQIPQEEYKKQENFKVVNVDQFDTAESQDYRSILNSIDSPAKINELKSKENEDKSIFGMDFFGMFDANPDTTTPLQDSTEVVTPLSDASPHALRLTNEAKPNVDEATSHSSDGQPRQPIDESVPSQPNFADVAPPTDESSSPPSFANVAPPNGESMPSNSNDATPPRRPNYDEVKPLVISETIRLDNSTEITTEVGSVESTVLPSDESMEGDELTTVRDEVEGDSTQSTNGQTALDLMLLQTSTSTEVSHETEICYKGRCVKSRNKKLRKPSS